MSVVEASGGGRTRSSAIFGIRAVASLGLLTVHVAMFSALLGTREFEPAQPPSNVVGAFFVSGMPAFIGVLFALPAMFYFRPVARAIIRGERAPSQRNGFMRRMLRLLPAYYVLYAVMLLTLNRDVLDDGWSALWPALLLHIYVPTPFEANPMNGMEVTWSVPSMVQWYLALPLVAWAVQGFARRGATPAARARRLMLPVPLLMGIGIAWLFVVTGQGWDHRIIFWWPLGFAPTIAVGVFMAVQLALAEVSPKDTPRLVRLATARPQLFWLASLGLYVVNCVRPFSVIGMDDYYSVSGLFIAYVIVSLFGLTASLPLVVRGARRTSTERVLGSGVLAYLGKISYGVYLWHMAAMHFYLQPGTVFGGEARTLDQLYAKSGFWALEAATLTGAVILASLSYFLLERPIMRWADRRFADPGRRAVRPGPAGSVVPRPTAAAARTTKAAPPEDVAASVAAAVADRDAIRSNLVDLDRSLGRQLLDGADLTGRTRRAWDEAARDLATLWEIFNAYSAVVDQASRGLDASGRPPETGPAGIAELFDGPTVLVSEEPPPLAQRHITDDGQRRLTPAAAVERMNELFRGLAELVTHVEAVWNEVTGRLDDLRTDLERVRVHSDNGGTAPSEAVAAAHAELDRLRTALTADPLSLWQGERTDTADLDRLAEAIAALHERARHPAGHDGGPGDAARPAGTR
ncbi:acyltransferase family protein [Actinomadura namibiensis]|uniref:Peptidoglycan/LPS O-acetylase OafA/YrhL n=1 Tax=Actinomadura namibiensis TaxID=182080 RepID=A0A7W3LRN3_ACTNM|nr:acyltransferase [Actinomadura namibiensis]MBA8953044.1 peptidoglycan/LPS O-acetylase OafA/YrhL [Actinomadura namibiensis]